MGARIKKRRHASLETHSEHDEQVAVMTWAALMSEQYPGLRLLFAVPNGARVAMRQAVKLKREGLRAGVPDLVLPVARAGYHGAFIEMKAVKASKLSDKQKWWAKELREQGYYHRVCKGAEEAIYALERYMAETL